MIRTIALICTHNGDRYLREQIDSLLSQTCLLDKIYIFDFNSKDNTVVVSKEVLCENENVHLEVFDFAPGPALSFFIGIDSIRRAEVEDYLLYLVDQDDVWLETKNSFILNEYDKLHFDFAFHDVKVVDVDLKVLRSNYYGRYWNVERDFNYPSQLFSNCVIGHTCILHSDFVKVLSLPRDKRIAMHDWHIANQALALNKEVIFFSQVLSLYRQHDGNILGAQKSGFLSRLSRMWNYSKVLKEYHEYLLSYEPELLRGLNPNSLVLMLRGLRPVRKLVYVFLIKFIFRV